MAFVDLNHNDRWDEGEPTTLFEEGAVFDLVDERADVGLSLGAPSVDAVLSIARSGDSITISWPAEAVGYQLWTTPQLVGGEWRVVEGVDGNSVTLVASDAQGYFQLRQP